MVLDRHLHIPLVGHFFFLCQLECEALCEYDDGDVMAPNRHNDVFDSNALLNTLRKKKSDAEAALCFQDDSLSVGVGKVWVRRSGGDTVGKSRTRTR